MIAPAMGRVCLERYVLKDRAMNLQIPEGSNVYSADGEDLGTVRQFVVQPSTAELTHLLIEKGVFFTDDRVVPVETIDRVEDDRVVLADQIDPAALPRFVRDHYALVDDQTRDRLGLPTGTHFMRRYPTAMVGLFPPYPAYPIPPEGSEHRTVDDPVTRDHLAEGEVVGPRTPVVSAGGDKVGTVAEMQVDEGGLMSHLVVDFGFLEGEKVLPAHWIDSIDPDGVHLAVGDDALESLETVT